MAIEFELKYKASEESLAALEQDVVGKRELFRMETTYYDTPSGALSARKFTLRRRLENDRSVCTLKIPVDGLGRGEFELECDSITLAIPELCKLSGLTELPVLTAEGVVPVCGAKFQRTAITLQWQGATLELALDRGCLTGGNCSIPLWEAEVELKSGSREAACSYGQFLSAAYGLTVETRSKFRRALRLAKGE